MARSAVTSMAIGKAASGGSAEKRDGREGDIGAEGHDVAMREMPEAQHAVDQRQADRAERIDAAEHDAGDEVEVDEVHRVVSVVREE